MTDADLRAYLLRQTTEADAERVEVRALDDDDFFATLESVEDDLFDDYVRGRMADDERPLFLAKYGAERARLQVARALMESGVDVLIEKPLAASLAEADELIALAQRLGRIGQVGHLERFNSAVRATLPLITQPMFFEVHRLSVFTPRSLDVDVVVDLMIHDLDIVLSFVNSRVTEIRAVGLPILSAKVDIANVRLQFASGCVANFTASRVSTERVRKLRFFQPRQYVSLDYGRQDVTVFSVGGDGAGVPSVNPQIAISKPATVGAEPLHAELKAFLAAVRERSKPLVSLEEGRRALEVALDIVAAIAQHGKSVNLAGIGTRS